MGLFGGLFGDSLDTGNALSPLGALGGKIQKWTDPIAWIPGLGDKWVDLTSNKIPELSNKALRPITKPLNEFDKTVNPLRKIPMVNNVAELAHAKPADSIGLAIGSAFTGGALSGALGGASSGAGGAAAGIGGAGAGGASGFAAAPTGLFSGLLPGGGMATTGYTSSTLPVFSMNGTGAIGGLGIGTSNPITANLSNDNIMSLLKMGGQQSKQPEQTQEPVKFAQNYQPSQQISWEPQRYSSPVSLRRILSGGSA